jgi:hypothetical protein
MSELETRNEEDTTTPRRLDKRTLAIAISLLAVLFALVGLNMN